MAVKYVIRSFLFSMENRGELKNRNSSYLRKFDPNFDQGKRNLIRVSGVFELSDLELTE